MVVACEINQDTLTVRLLDYCSGVEGPRGEHEQHFLDGSYDIETVAKQWKSTQRHGSAVLQLGNAAGKLGICGVVYRNRRRGTTVDDSAYAVRGDVQRLIELNIIRRTCDDLST